MGDRSLHSRLVDPACYNFAPLTLRPTVKRLFLSVESAVRTRSIGALVMVLIISAAHYFRTHQFGWSDLMAGVVAYAVVIIAFAGVNFVRCNPGAGKTGQ
jgi:hypothetical protein